MSRRWEPRSEWEQDLTGIDKSEKSSLFLQLLSLSHLLIKQCPKYRQRQKHFQNWQDLLNVADKRLLKKESWRRLSVTFHLATVLRICRTHNPTNEPSSPSCLWLSSYCQWLAKNVLVSQPTQVDQTNVSLLRCTSKPFRQYFQLVEHPDRTVFQTQKVLQLEYIDAVVTGGW